MYNGKISEFRFEHDSDTNRIMVYEEGRGVEPVSLIHVKPNLTEKDFHIEIMDFYSKSGN